MAGQREHDERILVLATYGQAMMHAQLLEVALIQLAHLQLPSLPADASIDDAWERVQKLFKRTAGQVARQLDVPEPLAEQISGAVGTRNDLAHRYLRDRAREMETTEGRHTMFRALMRATAELHQAIRALDPEITRLGTARGARMPEPEPSHPWMELTDLVAGGHDPPWPGESRA